ncbi:HAD-superfamily hydrolase [Jackrogersella minutella]|nr:HAD-superfamily hydrolase [Jackrogersella minutella]
MAPVTDRSVAFAFDIDGVLVKGKKPLPGARDAIQLLQEKHVPFMFLTNGGGFTEEAHVARLGKRLGLSTLSPQQFVQSHTPYLDLVPVYREKTVLVLGGHGQQIRNLAHAYGFNHVVTSSDVVASFKHIHPFSEMTRAHHDEHGHQHQDLRATPISAIMCWSSPRDWCLDLQLIQDLLLSKGGVLGTVSPKNGDATLENNGYLQDGQPQLFFCNPDFEWCTEHEQPRFAQGAFHEACAGIWKRKTGTELEYTMFGKPSEATYLYAENVLREYGKSMNLSRGIDTVYMIGDNPESDVDGANSFRSRHGVEWKSVLVETGVYVPGSIPKHQPYHTVKDVMEAVEWALTKEGGLN